VVLGCGSLRGARTRRSCLAGIDVAEHMIEREPHTARPARNLGMVVAFPRRGVVGIVVGVGKDTVKGMGGLLLLLLLFRMSL
jgi:hypothetical protein